MFVLPKAAHAPRSGTAWHTASSKVALPSDAVANVVLGLQLIR
jgi:hypothetical protein